MGGGEGKEKGGLSGEAEKRQEEIGEYGKTAPQTARVPRVLDADFRK
jgi:hypothetical protein